MASNLNAFYSGQNSYPQYGQQPVANGMYPQYSNQHSTPNMSPLQQQQQQSYLPGYQPQQQQSYLPGYQPQQQQQYLPGYQQQQQQQQYLPGYQQQQYCQTTSNTFPIDAILFYDDDKPYYEFTNFAKIEFKLDGHNWPTSEHYFQAQKFEGYPTIQREIRHLHGAREAFEFVRKPANKSLIRKDWAERKEEIMYKALKAKFSQNNDLRDKLLQTKYRMLVEDSPYDPYWGIGSDRKGKNRLGELLMKLRTELRTTITTTSPHTSYNTSSTTTQTNLRRSSSVGRLDMFSSPPRLDDKITYDVNDRNNYLSNCYPAKFMLDGKDWPTVLHYFVARKFDLKKSHVSEILSMKNCEEVHAYSRNLKIQFEIVLFWDTNKKRVMKQGLKAKFEQNLLLKDKLLKTGISKIIERSTEDEYWSQLASGSGRNVMGDLLCQVRDKLNTRPSTPPNSSSNKLKSLASNFISTVLPSSPKTTDSHSSSKRLSQPTIPSYKFTNILADTTVNQSNDSIHFTDFVDGGFYHDFSTYSSHGFRLDGEYWKSVQHYFQAHKYSSSKWLMDKIRSANTSKGANEIGKDKLFTKHLVRNWDFIREEIMFKVLQAKFQTHANLKDTLLATGDGKILNDSENEFWGRGKDGKGKNTLGMLLMKVRKECSNTDVSKSFLQPSNTNTSYSHHPSPKTPSNDDVIEFYDTDKPYFEFTPYSRHAVCLDGILWKTLNHYFQAQKFTSNNEKRKIADAATPDRATYIANNELRKFSKIQNFDDKEKIMKKGLEAKFNQHPDLRRMLLATGTRKLLFIHPKDMFWGTASSGQNKLGELLMKLREKLSTPTPNSNPKYNPANIETVKSHASRYGNMSISRPPNQQASTVNSYDEYKSNPITISSDEETKLPSVDSIYNSRPPKQQVTSRRRHFLSILMILVLIIAVLIHYFQT